MTIKANGKLYFIGIGGTGMASSAGLAQEAGYQVSGSDANLYPPMSDLLESLKVDVKTPYSASNVEDLDADLVIVANALSRGHEELEAALEKGVDYTSFPQFLGENILRNRQSIVVSGTHGKTTTTSMMAHVLRCLNIDAGYLIGGIPKGFDKSFHLGKDQPFAIEGDEYDTAFFDKNSKFLHYFPKYLIFNNLEFDHADIFENLEAIEAEFLKLFEKVSDKKNILANIDDPGVLNFLEKNSFLDQVTQVSTLGQNTDAEFRTISTRTGSKTWTAKVNLGNWGELEFSTNMLGQHNIANLLQVLSTVYRLAEDKIVAKPSLKDLKEAIESFGGVQRRLDHLCSTNDIDVFEDFAHHPTAVGLVLDTFKKSFPDRRLFVAFEPRNATSRRNIFSKRFADSLNLADQVLIGHCPVDKRIPEAERMDTGALAKLIGAKAEAFEDNTSLLDSLLEKVQPNDAVIFMSSGSFSGIQYQICDKLADVRN